MRKYRGKGRARKNGYSKKRKSRRIRGYGVSRGGVRL